MQNKKVLMFGPSYFGYAECIVAQLEAMGAQVDFYNDRPNNSGLCKALVRYQVKAYYPKVVAHYTNAAEENKDKDYDFIFVIKSECVDANIMKMLREHFPRAKCILYMWDGLHNIPHGTERLCLYDRVATFDHNDAEKYDLILRPLFFRKEYATPSAAPDHYDYDVSFIGTAHSIRPKMVKAVADICKKEGRNIYQYLFLPSKLVYFYNKLFNKAYRKVRKGDIHFTSISADEVRRIYDTSRCILDVEHVSQRGLTIRTIEMIGMGKKLITTNTGIKKYDFYNPKNILILDRDNPQIPAEFWESAYEPIPQKIINRYSLESFVRELFEVKE